MLPTIGSGINQSDSRIPKTGVQNTGCLRVEILRMVELSPLAKFYQLIIELDARICNLENNANEFGIRKQLYVSKIKSITQ